MYYYLVEVFNTYDNNINKTYYLIKAEDRNAINDILARVVGEPYKYTIVQKFHEFDENEIYFTEEIT